MKDNQKFLILIILLIVFLYFLTKNNKKVEKFTQNDKVLAQTLLVMFNDNQIPTFTKYLKFLTDNNNTNDNLISKGLYNKLSKKREKELLKLDDILEEM